MVDSTPRGAARTATLVALPFALVTGVAVYWLLGGFRSEPAAQPARPQATTAVELPATPLGDRPAAVCRALFATLPPTLGDLARRPVTAGAGQNAAYGDPPVTVVCGGAGPAVPADAQLFEINGVCWWAEDLPDRSVWHLLGREVAVAVTVPKAHTGPSRFVVDLGGPIEGSIAAQRTACTA